MNKKDTPSNIQFETKKHFQTPTSMYGKNNNPSPGIGLTKNTLDKINDLFKKKENTELFVEK